jgi:hypothetical protein
MRHIRLGRRLTVVGVTLAVALEATATSVGAFSRTQENAGTGKTLVTFDGGIGVQPVSAGNGQALVADTVNRNIVRGVQPPGQPWVIAAFNAKVKADGRITAHGRGLVFAGGDTTGTALVITNGVAAASLRVFARSFVNTSLRSSNAILPPRVFPWPRMGTSQSTTCCRRHRRPPAQRPCCSSGMRPAGAGSRPASRSLPGTDHAAGWLRSSSVKPYACARDLRQAGDRAAPRDTAIRR